MFFNSQTKDELKDRLFGKSKVNLFNFSCPIPFFLFISLNCETPNAFLSITLGFSEVSTKGEHQATRFQTSYPRKSHQTRNVQLRGES